MRSDILKKTAIDLLSIPPLIVRGIRRNFIRTTHAHADLDITPQHFEVMKLLMDKGTLHIAEIGDRQQIAKAQMTKLIDKLVEANMVERQTDTTDRRIINIVLTTAGRQTLEEHEAIITGAICETLSCLTDAEIIDLSDSLRKIREILSKLR